MSTLLCQATLSQLLIIDIQAKLVGAMPDQPAEQVIRNNQILIQAAKTLGIPISYTEQYPQGLGATHSELSDLLDTASRYEKTCFSSCGAAGIDQQLHDISRPQVIITGIETHICVLQTALQLLNQGSHVIIAQDGVCSRRKANFKNAIARMRQAGAIIANTESILFEWLGDASHPEFRTLSKLIR